MQQEGVAGERDPGQGPQPGQLAPVGADPSLLEPPGTPAPPAAEVPPPDQPDDPGSLRGIARLAVPALGALVAQPLFVLVDAAIVGTLGTAPLAGLGAAATIASLAVGLCVFLAYATTSSVARRVGEHRWDAAVSEGVEGMALGLGLGAAIGVVTFLAAEPLVRAFGASDVVTP